MRVRCNHCGLWNTTDQVEAAPWRWCNRCGTKLPRAAGVALGRRALSGFVFGCALWYAGHSAQSLLPRLSIPGWNAHLGAPAHPPAVRPSTGVHQIFTDQERVAGFGVRALSGNEDAYLKLVRVADGTPVITFYLRTGERLTALVPLGRYRLRYALGQTWYGDTDVYGATTRFREVERPLEFYRTGDGRIADWYVGLQVTGDGGSPAHSIRRDQF